MAVVVTGMGCVTPIGIGLPAFSESLRAGTSGTGEVTRFDPRAYRSRVAAEVKDFRPADFLGLREVRALPRVSQLAVAASRMALDDAGVREWKDAGRVGLLLGSSGGPVAYQFEQAMIFLERGLRRMNPMFPAYGHSGSIASECAIQFGVKGPVLTVSSACTSSADAIGLAVGLLEGRMVDVVLAGGTDAPVEPILFGSFDRIGAIARGFNDVPETASRPFSRDRDGFVLAEGAAVFVLERRDAALERGARIRAEIAGYGATCDADNHLTQEASGVEAARALRQALEQAGVEPHEIDYVNAHGTATRQNDPFETRVMHQVFGDVARSIPVSSSKSMFGHALGACGALELGATILGMEEGFVPPTLNLDEPDPDCDLDYVAHKARPARVDVALSTSFGFGSRNAALVVRKAHDVAA